VAQVSPDLVPFSILLPLRIFGNLWRCWMCDGGGWPSGGGASRASSRGRTRPRRRATCCRGR
jgi:hypothetical protein